MQKQRLSEVVLLSALACCGVIVIHLANVTPDTFGGRTWAFHLLFSARHFFAFVVPLFLALGGERMIYTLQGKQPRYFSFLWKKIRRVFLPYALWVVIYYIYFVCLHYVENRPRDLFHYLLVGDLSAQFYFVVIIFQFYLLMPLWRWMCAKIPWHAAIFSALVLTLLSRFFAPSLGALFHIDFFLRYSDRIFTGYLIYWVMGCYMAYHLEAFQRFVRSHRLLCLLSFALGALLYVAGEYALLRCKGSAAHYFCEVIKTLYTALAIPGLYALALLWADGKQRLKRAITLFDSSSYYIYLSHVLTIYIVRDFTYLPPLEMVFRCGLAVALIDVPLCMLYTWLKSKVRFRKGKK